MSRTVSCLKVENWSPETRISKVFRILTSHTQIYLQYLINYPQADSALQRCLKASPSLLTITSRLIIQNQATSYPLPPLLHKPIVRVQNTLPAQIIENTPADHPGT